MTDQIIANHYGGLVAVYRIDGGKISSHFGLVENIVMNQGRHMNEFHDRGQLVVLFSGWSEGFGRQEQQCRRSILPRQPQATWHNSLINGNSLLISSSIIWTTLSNPVLMGMYKSESGKLILLMKRP